MNQTLNALTNKIEVAPISETDLWLIVLITAIALIGLAIHLILLFQDFVRELKLLNMEIRRSEGAEREHYLRRRRRLWLSLIPFVRY